MHKKPSELDNAISEIVKLWVHGDPVAALQESEALLAQHASNEQVLLAHTGLLLHQQDFIGTKALLAPAHAANTLSPGLMANLSIALRGCGEHEAALALALEMVAVAPDKPSGWNALGLAYLELGRLDEAKTAFESGLEHHPDHPALKHHLHQALQKLGQAHDDESSAMAGDFISYANGFSQEGNPIAAEAALRHAIQLQPRFFASYTSLGCFLMRYGRIEEARPYLEKAHALNPEHPTTRHFLALARGEKVPTPSSEYIAELFDGYADRFDKHLVDELEYVVPEVLSHLLLDRLTEPVNSRVLDLGCGTGLVGEHLGSQVLCLDGVDLSQNMLDKAAVRGMYASLTQADIRDFFTQTNQQWHGIVAADVLIYCGDIADIIASAYRCLLPGGWLAFSVELSMEDAIIADPQTGRYQHSKPYLEKVLGSWFESPNFIQQVLRQNAGAPVEGLLILAQRRA